MKFIKWALWVVIWGGDIAFLTALGAGFLGNDSGMNWFFNTSYSVIAKLLG